MENCPTSLCRHVLCELSPNSIKLHLPYHSSVMVCDQVTDIVAGVVRWKRYLDFLIFSFFKQDVRDYDRMEPLLRQVLSLCDFKLVC